MIDTSDDAIEADLERAARGGPAAATWVAWAQVRATLAARTAEPAPETSGRPALAALSTAATSPDIQIAVGPFGDSYAVPATASWDDRVTAAARMLGMEADPLADLLRAAFGPAPAWDGPVPPEGETTVNMPEAPSIVVEAPAEPDFELDIDEDAVDEDEVDDDFFAEAREARDR